MSAQGVDGRQQRILALLIALVVGGVLIIAVSGWMTWESNRTAAKIADCNKRVIRTLSERDEQTARLRALTDADQANLARLIGTLSSRGDSAAALQAYLAESRRIDAAREKARARQDRATYPALDDCL